MLVLTPIAIIGGFLWSDIQDDIDNTKQGLERVTVHLTEYEKQQIRLDERTRILERDIGRLKIDIDKGMKDMLDQLSARLDRIEKRLP